jgi:hypothetical protein
MTTLSDLRAAVAANLNFDPANDSYEVDLDGLINRAQTKVLGSHRWSFAQRETLVTVFPDYVEAGIPVILGQDFVDLSLIPADFRKAIDGHTLFLTSSTNVQSQTYNISFADLAGIRVYLTSPITQATGTYTVTVQFREIALPGDTASVEGLLDLSVGIPEPQRAMTKLNRDVIRLDPNTTGRSLYFIPSTSVKTPTPRAVSGVATVAGVAQGIRTIYVFQTFSLAGRESALSAPVEYKLTDIQTLTFTAPAIQPSTGLYRKFYFSCPQVGIKRPVLVDASVPEGVDPLGGVTLAPDLSLATISSESYLTNTIPYMALGSYRRFNLWPHPALVTQYQVRIQVLPQPMIEDGDAPLIPPDAAQVIEYEATSTNAIRLDNPSLGKMYRDLRDGAYRQMSQTYLMQSTAPVVMMGASGSTKGPISLGPYKVVP